MAYAEVLNAEIRALEAAGCDVVQLDEPVFTRVPEKLEPWGIEALDRAFAGTRVASCVHVCHGYRARLGNKEWKHGYAEIFPALARAKVERYSLEFAEPKLSPEILSALPGKLVELGVIDTGTTRAKMRAFVLGTEAVRLELARRA
jgi:5-methyltetrahydropteroyltriglutamate--homocysteine methyltransferase